MKKDDYNDKPPSHGEMERLFKDDEELSVVLRGHLHLERYLALLLEQALPDSEMLDVFDLRFPLKVDMAAALGVIPVEERETFKCINRIRNRFAHDSHAYFSSEDAAALWESLSPRIRGRLANAGRCGPQDFSLDLDLFKCVAIAVCYLLAEGLREKCETETTT